jgi:hypothetical protein
MHVTIPAALAALVHGQIVKDAARGSRSADTILQTPWTAGHDWTLTVANADAEYVEDLFGALERDASEADHAQRIALIRLARAVHDGREPGHSH